MDIEEMHEGVNWIYLAHEEGSLIFYIIFDEEK
jgi:hypothetical protein